MSVDSGAVIYNEWMIDILFCYFHTSVQTNTQLSAEKTNHVQQQFPFCPPQMLPCSPLMLSRLLEVPELPHNTIITYSHPCKSNSLNPSLITSFKVFFLYFILFSFLFFGVIFISLYTYDSSLAKGLI